MPIEIAAKSGQAVFELVVIAYAIHQGQTIWVQAETHDSGNEQEVVAAAVPGVLATLQRSGNIRKNRRALQSAVEFDVMPLVAQSLCEFP